MPEETANPAENLSASGGKNPDYFKHLTPAQRAAILDEYLKEGRSITAICKEYGISRPTFYKWLKRYEAGGRRSQALEDKTWKITYHPKQIPWDLEKKIIHLAIRHPHLSTHKIAKLVRDVGNHGVQSVFEKHGLNLYEKRLRFRWQKLAKTPWTALLVWGEEMLFLSIPLVLLFFVGKLTYDLFRTAPTGFEMVGYIFAEIALVIGSFFFLYSLKYYITVALVLAASRAQGGGAGYVNGPPSPNGYGGAGGNVYKNGFNGNGKFPIGNGYGSGFRRNGLFKRFLRGPFSRGREAPPAWKGVGRPPRAVAEYFSSKGGKNGNGLAHPLSLSNGNGNGNGNGYANGKVYPDAGGGTHLPFHGGLAGKLFGKYLNSNGSKDSKVSHPDVVGKGPSFLPNGNNDSNVSNGVNGNGNGYGNGNGINGDGNGYANGNGISHPFHSGLGGKLFGKYLNGNGKSANGPSPANGFGKLTINGGIGVNGRNGFGFRNGLDNGGGWGTVEEFERQFASEVNRVRPFVSIHLPLYNEKKVVDRLMEACAHLTYKNYEVVVIDDSDDGTTDIIRSWQDRLVNEKLKIKNEKWGEGEGKGSQKSEAGIKEYTLPDGTFVREAKDHFTLKLVHRPTREGFKGGALNHALRVTDPKTSYIAVFDADFIPFPDTIEQFLKYFYFLGGGLSVSPKNRIAAIQGYQWHILNKDENWITAGVRYEYAGSYVIERSGTELFGTLKQIAGSVYMIRKDLLDQYGWGHSITEDFQLTLRLYEAGYKVVYTPYIQAPAECVSTLKRLIRQRMRWAEGHTHNVRLMFKRLIDTPFMATREKLEFMYLSPYYLQAAFLITGTLFWFISEMVFNTKLPFWTAVWGWSLVVTNFLSLPLMNSAGLFLEEGEKKDYGGMFSFIALTYILAPFQAWASIKGMVEKAEGPWFRTPKTGLITISLARAHFARILRAILPGRGRRPSPALSAAQAISASRSGRASPSAGGGSAFGGNPSGRPWPASPKRRRGERASPSAGSFRGSFIPAIPSSTLLNPPKPFRRRRIRFLSKGILSILIIFTVTLYNLSQGVPITEATTYTDPFYLYNDTTALLTNAWQLVNPTSPPNTPDTLDSTTSATPAQNAIVTVQYYPGTSNSTAGTLCSSSPNGRGWVWTTAFQQGGTIAAGQWTFYLYESDSAKQPTGNFEVCVYAVTLSGGSISGNTLLFNSNNPNDTAFEGDILDVAVSSPAITTTSSIGPFTFNADEYLYVEYWVNQTVGWGGGTSTSTFSTGNTTGTTDPRIVTPTVTIPELAILFLAAAPLVPYAVQMWVRKRQGLAASRRLP